MSALAKPQPPRDIHRVRVAIRGGAVVRVKFCPGCQRDKVVTDDRHSGFPLNGRTVAGGRRYRPICKTCFAAAKRAAYGEDAEAARARNRATHARWIADPATAAAVREQERLRRRHRRATEPEFRSVELERSRLWKAKKRREDPTYFTPERRAERMAARTPRVVELPRSAPRVDTGPFREWLVAYRAAAGLLPGQAQALSTALGLPERRVYAILAREQAAVGVDTVDRALTAARYVVEVGGRPIITLDDLYPAA